MYSLAYYDNNAYLTETAHFLDDFRKLFTHVRYSDVGCNSRVKEEQTYMFFIDYLEDCELGECSTCNLCGLVCHIHIIICNVFTASPQSHEKDTTDNSKYRTHNMFLPSS